MNLFNEKLEAVTSEKTAILKEGENTFYIRALNRSFYNPYDLTHRCGFRKTTFVKVNKNIYELYLKFLDTKLVRYKIQAERLL